jgi:hypothetical protein
LAQRGLDFFLLLPQTLFALSAERVTERLSDGRVSLRMLLFYENIFKSKMTLGQPEQIIPFKFPAYLCRHAGTNLLPVQKLQF